MDNDTLQAALAAWAAGEHNDAGVSATPELLESGESSDYNDAQATDSHKSADSDNLIPRSAAATFDAEAFLKGLDAIFEAHEGATKAEPYLLQAMDDAENAGDDAGLLTVLNETMGFYRSQGRHEDNQWIVQRSIELALRMRLEGTEAWTTTLINAATSMRAAGRYDQAEDLYHQAIDSAKATLSPTDRRMAALHNNLSMLYSETGRPEQALHELEAALRVLEAASVDPSNDIDIAATHTNIALILLELPADERHTGPSGETEHAGAPSNRMTTPATSQGSPTDHSTPAAARLDEAMRHARRSLDIYRTAGQEHAGHYASALAGYAQVCLAAGHADEAVRRYRQALSVIEENYGRDNDYYRITAANLVQAQEKAAESELSGVIATPGTLAPDAAVPSGNTPARTIPGLKLARAYWNEYGKPLIAERYPEYQGRIATGLVGHGSECYGFDDELDRKSVV